MTSWATCQELGNLAEFAIIGGTGMERVVTAAHIRRQGASVFAEIQDRKAKKAREKAYSEAWTVIDLDAPESSRA